MKRKIAVIISFCCLCFLFSALQMRQTDVTVSGADVKDYTITFTSNGGSNCSSIVDIVPNTRVMLPTPEKSGYWFRGWYAEKALKTLFTSDQYVTKDMTLYAKWEAKENKKADTMTKKVTGDVYSTTLTIDLAEQNYDYTVSLSAVAVPKREIKEAVYGVAETDTFLGVNLNVQGIFYSSKRPLPVTVTLPEGFNIAQTQVYLTTNKTSIMAQMPHTVSGSSLNFHAYQDGVYVILHIPTEKEIIEQKEPEVIVDYKRYQLAVGKEMELSARLKNFSPDDMDNYTITWKSKNPKRASVDEDGWVTGLKAGKVKIRCKVKTPSGVYGKTIKLEILP